MTKRLMDVLRRQLSATEMRSDTEEPHGEEPQGEEHESGLSRRALLANLGITGGTIAGASLLPRLVGAQPPSTSEAGGNAPSGNEAGNAAGDSNGGASGNEGGAHRMGANMPRTMGEVDHKANGFNPSDVLTDFDYGKVSRLPNGQTLREWELVGQDKDIEVAPGIMFPAWTFNGRVPGPTLRATEGDRMRIHFRNESAMAHTIHFHGIHPFPMDGVPGAGPGPIAPGGSFTYEFDAEPFGCHLYHCHTFPLARHIGKGMYGGFICDPKAGRPKADHELVMVLNGIDIDFDDENDIYAVNTIPFHYQKNPIEIKVGDLVRVYLINVLEFDAINSFHLHANFFHYYPTGTMLQPSEFTDTIAQMQAQRGILEFRYKYPGTFMFHAHKTEFAELGWNGAFRVTPRDV